MISNIYIKMSWPRQNWTHLFSFFSKIELKMKSTFQDIIGAFWASKQNCHLFSYCNLEALRLRLLVFKHIRAHDLKYVHQAVLVMWDGRWFRVVVGILVKLGRTRNWELEMITDCNSDLDFTVWFDSIHEIKPKHTNFHRETNFNQFIIILLSSLHGYIYVHHTCNYW